jgi:hypothetical protein
MLDVRVNEENDAVNLARWLARLGASTPVILPARHPTIAWVPGRVKQRMCGVQDILYST